ncbi:MAG TPA: prepilin-type N-terminal cleavage/methylation domain-containing protein [Gemmatimonadales bacterium]|jgi:prepilin-type N-terminal cleavage/methylation domain-containing protein
MTTAQRQSSEQGLTLIEMLIALTVFSVVLAGALAFLRAQGRSFALGSQRSAMLQNSRFAFDELEKDLRTAGAGAPDIQPAMVYAGPSVVAFNANYATRTPGDVFAVYYDPDVPIGAADAARRGDRFTIPTTAVAYPDTDYLQGGLINSPAETITFFFAPDSTTSRTDDYILYRQVNDQAPEVVSRNLTQTGATPFLQYYSQVMVAGTPAIQQVANGLLPLQHSVPIHLAISDTGAAARIDSVRAVLVSFSVTNGLSGSSERRRPLSRYIRLPNVGLTTKQTCGDPPILGTGLTAAWNAATTGVDLTWNAAVDELSGERDVVRYVIWRKSVSDSGWGDPFLSFPPAGTPTYIYTDRDVTSGSKYIYGLAAQDCTPANSNLVASAEVDIP